ncbi:MAG: helix-hairpin-helix domain-containing protein [Acidobacteria bacterium]|nr:MAG: helix-hairpin-helix domain-containing protein [Acidobacteriota bacterium]
MQAYILITALILLAFLALFCLNCDSSNHLSATSSDQLSNTNALERKDFSTSLNTSETLVDINSASIDELERLPTIGKTLAERIVEHREKYGKFRRVEHLIIVRGMSDAKFRNIRHLVVAK